MLTIKQKKLVENNMNLVYKITSKYYSFDKFNPFIDDIQQAGFEGLCRAAIIYDENKGMFSTIAYPYIKGFISRFFKDNGINLIKGLDNNQIISLDKKMINDDGSEFTYEDLIEDKIVSEEFYKIDNDNFIQSEINKIKKYITQEEYDLILKYVKKELQLKRGSCYNNTTRKVKNIFRKARLLYERNELNE